MTRTVRRLLALLSVLCLTVAAGCQSSGTAAPGAALASGKADTGSFPVTIKHAFGSTTIDKKPTRVATWGFGSTDAVLALGVVPVAMPKQTYAADKNGVLPWIKDQLDRMGAKTPTMLSNPDGSDEVPMEEIAKAKPDVILANYSGITAKQYATLSKIAPTVAYPDQPWATPWRDVVTTVGTVLGERPAAEKLLAGVDRTVKQKAADHPQLKGKTVAAVWDTGDTFYVYKQRDPRVGFLTDLGLVSAPSVEQLAPDDDNFYYTMSYEQVSKLHSDVLLVYADNAKQAQTLRNEPYAKTMQQVKTGHVAPVVGPEFVAAVSPPTALSLTWGIDGYLKALDTSVEK